MRNFTPEHREKLRQAKLRNPVRYWLGKSRPEALAWLSPYQSGHLSPFKGKRRPELAGENNPRWKGGASRAYKTGYNSLAYKEWRNSVFERDNYTCQDCGVNDVYVTAHHIKSFAYHPDLRFEITNGKTLCESCHAQTDNYKGRANRLAALIQ